MSERRPILFVSSNFPPVIGGSSVVYDHICRNGADRIVAAGAVCNHDAGTPWPGVEDFDRDCPYRIHRRSYLRPPIFRKRNSRLQSLWLDDLPVMLGTLFFLIGLIVRYRVKVVCLGELMFGGWLVFPLRYLLGRKVIIYTHGEEISQQDSTLFGRLRPVFLRHAHDIVAVSLFCKSQIVGLYGIDARRVSVIPNGVDLDVFTRGPADPQALPATLRGHPIVLSVSRLVERKGQEKLIRAFPAVLARFPEARCAIVGGGPLRQRLEAVVGELGLDGKVVFLGNVSLDQLVSLYRTCDLFALPCRTLPDGDTEGFGLVFLEANACGIPVVAGAAGGTVEAVIDGETGLVVDGNDPDDIARAVTQLLSDPRQARQLGEAGWRRAQNWGWPQVCADFMALCEGAPPRPAPEPPPVRLAPTPHIAPPARGGGGTGLLVTVDVEEEFIWTEFSRERHRVRGVEALRDFHEGCTALGISPVYLVTYPIMEDPGFSRFLDEILADGSGEVGIHLHTWTTPPFWEHPNAFNSFQCNLPAHIEREKIAFLARVYEDRFGRPVRIHRAGRWGGSPRTGDLLEEHGIPIDLSPSTGHRAPNIGISYSADLDGSPYWAGRTGRVLTVPASALHYLRGPDWVSTGSFSLRNRLPRLRQWGKPVRFSPEGQSTGFLATMGRQFAARQLPVAVYTLHSTSLYEGGNPYSQTGTATRELQHRAVEVLRLCIEEAGLRPTRCEEILKASVTATERAYA